MILYKIWLGKDIMDENVKAFVEIPGLLLEEAVVIQKIIFSRTTLDIMIRKYEKE